MIPKKVYAEQSKVNLPLISFYMIIKKLAVPLVNEKLLQQAEHCTIATAGLSEEGFDFIRSRIPTKTKMDIVTGLDHPTSPEVLRRIWLNYGGRIALHIYAKNVFHANLYLFDLPFRKAVAFIGSGSCTLEGLKDGEELFFKITDAKEIENLRSWFTGYFEFGEPLHENHIAEYELRYPIIKQHDSLSRQEKRQFISLTSGNFSWDQLHLKKQFFTKENFLALSSTNAHLAAPEVVAAREGIQAKLFQIDELLRASLIKLKLRSVNSPSVSSLQPADHPDQLVRSLGISYSRIQQNSTPTETPTTAPFIEVCLRQKEVAVSLMIGAPQRGEMHRESFKRRMIEPEFRKKFFTHISALGVSYFIEVAGERKALASFPDEEALWAFTKQDGWRYYPFVIERGYSPTDPEISSDNIGQTLLKEIEKLAPLYDCLMSAD
jgi:hypothetical protein